jgi:hypothetical protein
MDTFLLFPGNSIPMMDVNIRHKLACKLSVGHYNPPANNQTVRNRTVANSRFQGQCGATRSFSEKPPVVLYEMNRGTKVKKRHDGVSMPVPPCSSICRN